jgi:hypothetical protein
MYVCGVDYTGNNEPCWLYVFHIPYKNSYKITGMKMLVTLNGNDLDRRRYYVVQRAET